ncbi:MULTISPECIES: beta-ketoacyl synthase N-terminal-like domain-containing protein [Flavobacterium]|uniref:Beta-ketoacyl synthase N-terminal-like domain-containing protein n=1 Tax=Flavobacterium covae TaxID=2906076 RepID=A0ABW8PIJ5_9FLAO|nr:MULTISPECIES: beta-ketoacyl synthase N-terminal-like domain-containing protein [Flavobacterium]OXA77484.1 beta-ketoacyl synthase [Flavobacterium columnare] [Flavobacterium columnare NBRC 100251 = ATCC 23463]AMA48080.1 beta-ketoacyl synthase [Flavobacterium covae]AND63773.1 beta-ketoacyl synthase [Flavobacterium covae]MCH4829985.1 beta-ketoacyl synthase [Flavobacterium columnare]MCH4832635.1 beta-ketoacyl synthase [Flavobacterium columnare]
MKQKIAITSVASMSALGNQPKQIWSNYLLDSTCITTQKFNNKKEYIAKIPKDCKVELEVLRQSDLKYKALDQTVLMAILTSRNAVKQAGWKEEDNFGINIGSSRGATQLFEYYHKDFLETGITPTLTSPTTTLGNISSWVAHDLKNKGLAISHSITCSTGLHSLLNGVAWLQAGMMDKFLVGASEAPLTDFTIAQMNALKIYAKENQAYPCRAFDLQKTKNSMILGEGATSICLDANQTVSALAYVEGVGFATDELQHNISISEEAMCFQKSMKMALGDTSLDAVDVIVMHAPGTIKGDSSEYKAIEKIFKNNKPLLTTNKWKLGHTFGTSGLLSIEMAILMMQVQYFIGIPYLNISNRPKTIKKVLVNAVGFGGNAVSVLLSI